MTRASRSLALALMPVALLHLAFLSPVLRTGYVGDDNINSALPGYFELTGKSAFGFAGEVARAWIEQGRFFPVAFYQTFGLFDLLQDSGAYKSALILLAVATAAVFAALLHRLWESAPAAALVALTAVLLCQLRDWHDPNLAYAGMMQAVLLEVALSALLFQSWLRTRRWWALAASLALLALAACTYESAPLLAALHVIVAWSERERLVGALRAAAPPLALSAAFLALAAFLRLTATVSSPEYTPRLQLGLAAKTFAIQESGTFPLTYAAFDPNGVFVNRSQTILGGIGWLAVVLGVAVALVAWRLLSRVGAAAGPPLAWPLIGVVLLVLPALPLALAPKYQDELLWGLSYMPVYMQAFGLATLAVSALVALRRAVPSLAAPLAVGMGAFAVVAFSANDVVADRLAPAREQRDAAAAALRAGALASVPAGGKVYVENGPLWMSADFAYMYARRRTTVEGQPAPALAALRAQRAAAHWLRIGTDLVSVTPVDPSAGRALVYDVRTRGLARLPGDFDPNAVEPVGVPGVGLAWLSGCGMPEVGPPPFRWCDASARLAVYNATGQDRPLRLTFQVATVGPKPAVVRLAAGAGAPATAPAARSLAPIARSVVVPARRSVLLRMSTDGERLKVPGDPRRLFMRATAPAVAVPGAPPALQLVTR